MSTRRRRITVIGAVLVAGLVVAGLLASVRRHDRHPAPAAVASRLPCGAKGPEDLTTPARPAPASPANKVLISPADPSFITSFQIVPGKDHSADRVYVLADSRRVLAYDLDTGALRSSFTLAFATGSLAVDPDGGVYVSDNSVLYKFGPDGAALWQRPVTDVVTAVYVAGAKPGFRVGVVKRRAEAPYTTLGSELFDADGARQGTTPVVGTQIQRDRSTGDLISTDDNYVRVYNPDGVLRNTFGSSLSGHDPGPFHFVGLGGATRAPKGALYVLDAGIFSFTADGLYRGVAPDNAQAPLPSIGRIVPKAHIEEYDGRIYYPTSGPAGPFAPGHTLSSIATDDLENIVGYPKGHDPRLGIGAGLTLPSHPAAGYFQPGQTPAANVEMDPWWSAHAGDITGTYTVRERSEVMSGTAAVVKTFALPSSATGTIVRPLQLPAPEPGYYQVEVKLTRGSQVLSADCLYYAVGPAGSAADFAGLPAGADTGGALPRRDVALSALFGVDLVRVQLSTDRLLPGGAGSNAPLDFSYYDDNLQLKQAARDAAAKGITFEVQVGQGTATDYALINSPEGLWRRRVEEIVRHYAGIVHSWEAWNEPNGTSVPASEYVDRVLTPFWQGVKAADPAATVVGGTVVGLGPQELDYWETIATAGALDHLDVVAIHPYTGYTRSFEAEGLGGQLVKLKEVLARHGGSAKPIWATESGFTSCFGCPGNFYTQGDKLVRARILFQDAGVSRWNYFFNEGDFGTYSLATSAAIKPGGLAALNDARLIGRRPLQRLLPTGVPHTYAALFGPDPPTGATGSMVVVWADDFTTELDITLSGGPRSVDVADSMGRTRTVAGSQGTFRLSISGSPQYVPVPGGAAVTIAPVESFSEDVALASNGASATATSDLPHNKPASVIDGVSDFQGNGGHQESSMWAQDPSDHDPAVTVRLAGSTKLDRVLVTSTPVDEVLPGLRDYDVEVRDGAGPWAVVSRVRGAFFERRTLVRFPARVVTEIRISGMAINWGGYFGGLKPYFAPTDPATLADLSGPWYGPMLLAEVEAFGPDVTSSPGGRARS